MAKEVRINFAEPVTLLAYQAVVIEPEIRVDLAQRVAEALARDILQAARQGAAQGQLEVEKWADVPDLTAAIQAGTVEVRDIG